MTPEERQEIRERDKALGQPFDQSMDWDDSDWRRHGAVALDDRRALLADYDHLVAVASRIVERVDYGGQVITPGSALYRDFAALRALIDPATPEPVEGEPHA